MESLLMGPPYMGPFLGFRNTWELLITSAAQSLPAVLKAVDEMLRGSRKSLGPFQKEVRLRQGGGPSPRSRRSVMWTFSLVVSP